MATMTSVKEKLPGLSEIWGKKNDRTGHGSMRKRQQAGRLGSIVICNVHRVSMSSYLYHHLLHRSIYLLGIVLPFQMSVSSSVASRCIFYGQRCQKHFSMHKLFPALWIPQRWVTSDRICTYSENQSSSISLNFCFGLIDLRVLI